MPVSPSGFINLASLNIPDVYINIESPPAIVSGIPTDILGIVGVGSWGPVNSPIIAGGIGQVVEKVGRPSVRSHDLATAAWVAGMQGGNNFRLVRVTDGTDTAATGTFHTNCFTLTARHTGTIGNGISCAITQGRVSGSYTITIFMPGVQPEQFDNVAAGLSGNAVYVAIANAINHGVGSTRGPSEIVVATAGSGTLGPFQGGPVGQNITKVSFSLSGGTDGDGVDCTDLLGSGTGTRSGMYALRNTGASVAFLADCDDSTTWPAQAVFALSEGVYMIGTGPAGESISDAVTEKSNKGIDSYGFKLLLGDWVYFNDSINGNPQRLVSPQGFVAGKIAALSPEQSSLNKPMLGIVGTQRTAANRVYSSSELQALSLAGIDVITNPIPAGNVFGARFGRNSSSETERHGDNYTRMTNFLAYSLQSQTGRFIGKLQSKRTDDPFRRSLKLAIDHFLQGLVDFGMLDDFLVVCDKSNNSDDSIARGNCIVNVRAVYLSVVEYLIVNLEGGQTVSVTRAK